MSRKVVKELNKAHPVTYTGPYSFKKTLLTAECWAIQTSGRDACDKCTRLHSCPWENDIKKSGVNALGLAVPVEQYMGRKEVRKHLVEMR